MTKVGQSRAFARSHTPHPYEINYNPEHPPTIPKDDELVPTEAELLELAYGEFII